VKTPALVEAFQRVRREDFVGPGPWQLRSPGGGEGYVVTPDDDARRLYADVLVALIAERLLNNGQPSALASWIDQLALKAGDRVLHVGCGVGYYSAVMAEAVRPGGRVIAIELDGELAARARRCLQPWPEVEVVHGDGVGHDAGVVDAVLINAGVTRLPPQWIDRLAPGGRLMVPMTVAMGTHGGGFFLRVERRGPAFEARFQGSVSIFPCESARDEASHAQLLEALRSGSQRVRSLRRDEHARGDDCVLHGDGVCLSTREVAG
jgi:protein-L-isoaspartate(D-aspartate) O-methyltransferase